MTTHSEATYLTGRCGREANYVLNPKSNKEIRHEDRQSVAA